MYEGQRFLLGIMLSVCSSILFINPQYGNALEETGSDQTRPSKSIEGDLSEEVQQDLSDKNVPRPPKINDSMNDVKIKFDKIYVRSIHEDNHDWYADPNYPGHGTDTAPDGGELQMYLYIDGKRILFGPRTGIYTQPEKEYLVVPEELKFKIPANRALSIMIGGYEKDGCPVYEFPRDISKWVLSANGNKEYLLTLQKSLTNNLNVNCGPNDEKHDALGYINNVYLPPAYKSDANSDTVDSVVVSGLPDYRVTYHVSVTPVHTSEVQK